MLINESGEIDREFDNYMNRLEKCNTNEEVNIEFALHWARLNLIKKKYREHEKDINENGIDLGRGINV